MVDPGAPGNEKILEGAPKLVRIDLKTNKVTKVIAVPGDVALQGTYLNDIRFSPDGQTGYITDSGTRGAIIVVDLASGKSFRTLDVIRRPRSTRASPSRSRVSHWSVPMGGSPRSPPTASRSRTTGRRSTGRR